MIPLGIAASVLLVTGVALLVHRPLHSSPPSTTTVALRPVSSAPSGVRTAAASLVTIAPTSGGPTHDGMTLNPPTLVATTDTAATGSHVMVTNQAGQREEAVVVGHDPASGVSVISLAQALAPATPMTSPPSTIGTVDEVTLSTTSEGRPSIGWAPTEVEPPQSVALASGTMIGAMTPAAAIAAPSGDVLMTPTGEVEAMSAPMLGKNTFLPAAVVGALAAQMKDGATPSHARLGITGASSPNGVKVDSVTSEGAAAGVLKPGDVITQFNANPVSSMPLLLDDLYAAPGGSDAQITFERSGQQQQAALTLGKAP